jgi:hypothetical protein
LPKKLMKCISATTTQALKETGSLRRMNLPDFKYSLTNAVFLHCNPTNVVNKTHVLWIKTGCLCACHSLYKEFRGILRNLCGDKNLLDPKLPSLFFRQGFYFIAVQEFIKGHGTFPDLYGAVFITRNDFCSIG